MPAIKELLLRHLESRLPYAAVENKANRMRFLKETLGSLPAGGRILDVGAGSQGYRQFCDHLRYVSHDMPFSGKQEREEMLQMKDADYEEADITSDILSIPEADGSFDAIMCTEVLEHVPHPVHALQELARCIRPDGHLILTAPFCSLTHGFPLHFVSGFGRDWYEKHLPDAGFRIVEMTANGNFFYWLGQELVRSDGVRAYHDVKDKLTFFEELSLRLVQRMLCRFGRKDAGSSELLCFGWHVTARRR